MKKYLFIAIASITLASCHGDIDFEAGSNEAAIKANLENVFGGMYDPNNDWRMVTSGKLTIQADASVKNVMLLVNEQDVMEPEESWVSTNSISMLNQMDINGAGTYTMYYDIPIVNDGMYVAYTTDNGTMIKKVEGNTISLAGSARARVTRSSENDRLSSGYLLPDGTFTIKANKESYASQRGWLPGEKLWEMNDEDYAALRMDADKDSSYPQYTAVFCAELLNFLNSEFKNGRDYRNLEKVKSRGHYNEGVYIKTTGEDPVIVTPVYKRDQPTLYGNEVYNSDLYYYYFTDDQLPATKEQQVTFLEGLPKYKALSFKDCFDEAEDGIVTKHGSYALLYYGNGTPNDGSDGNPATQGSFDFPKDVNIGFMVRTNTDFEDGKKKGEVYGDGRLNNYINDYWETNFKSSKLGTDGPRAAWFTLGDGESNINHMYLIWESGTDADFNDIMVEVEGGQPFEIIEYEPKTYTYCFEDREEGDYDMNDVVITITRLSETKIQYAIVACGAYDELYIQNTMNNAIPSDKEVHQFFNLPQHTFINTAAGSPEVNIWSTETTVPAQFSIDFNAEDNYSWSLPQIFNKTTGKIVTLSKKGDDPHGILVPGWFPYPTEKTCIKNAYRWFHDWYLTNSADYKNWYVKPWDSKLVRSIKKTYK